MYRSISCPITQDNWREIASFIGALYCFPFGDRGAVLYCSELGGHFILTDNGGEINVSGVNRVIDLPSIPISSPTMPQWNCGPATAAYRIGNKMKGGEVDYRLDVDAELMKKPE